MRGIEFWFDHDRVAYTSLTFDASMRNDEVFALVEIHVLEVVLVVDGKSHLEAVDIHRHLHLFPVDIKFGYLISTESLRVGLVLVVLVGGVGSVVSFGAGDICLGAVDFGACVLAVGAGNEIAVLVLVKFLDEKTDIERLLLAHALVESVFAVDYPRHLCIEFGVDKRLMRPLGLVGAEVGSDGGVEVGDG